MGRTYSFVCSWILAQESQPQSSPATASIRGKIQTFPTTLTFPQQFQGEAWSRQFKIHESCMADSTLPPSRAEISMSGRTERRSGGPSQRSHPYARDNRRQPQEEEEDDDPNMPENAIKVSGSYDVKRLAETIAAACRSNEHPPLMTIGPNSVNQAVKVITSADLPLSLRLPISPPASFFPPLYLSIAPAPPHTYGCDLP